MPQPAVIIAANLVQKARKIIVNMRVPEGATIAGFGIAVKNELKKRGEYVLIAGERRRDGSKWIHVTKSTNDSVKGNDNGHQ